jgi:hypothetical protein
MESFYVLRKGFLMIKNHQKCSATSFYFNVSYQKIEKGQYSNSPFSNPYFIPILLIK